MDALAETIATEMQRQDPGCMFSPHDGLRGVAIDGVFDLEALAATVAAFLKVEELERVIAHIWGDRDEIVHYILESDAARDSIRFARIDRDRQAGA